jgi:hypothetical protein
VGFHGLLAEEQFRGDLNVGLAVGGEPRHLEFAFGQRLDPGSAGDARAGPRLTPGIGMPPGGWPRSTT